MKVSINGVSKKYKKTFVLRNVDLEFAGVYGLLGPNGAGKTTLMKIIAGMERLHEGEVYVDDVLMSKRSYVKRTDLIGYLPQDFMVYPDLSVYEVLEHIAHLQGMHALKIPGEIRRIIDLVHLAEHVQKKMNNLSGGMRRRVGIAQLLLRNPQVLVFDEPTAGLDIDERIRFRNLLRRLGATHTVIISSHLVEDIEFLCNRIGIIRKGVVLFEGTPSELKSFAKDVVFEHHVKHDQLDGIIDHEEVIQLEDHNEYVIVRVLTQHPGKEAGVRVEPRLIDGYLSLLRSDVYG
ncbi:ATP-binding cassette domain-containing protein [Geomicrobium sp. JSM 1781026]|uniref:ATP-binding cassette domain-containing protein n=1 Tax=Geomicrobium sp. JSM 1781026 TaxID=3344580 RepID=UPI0035C02C81